MEFDLDADDDDVVVDNNDDVVRLGICQKIYMTQFSGERILHIENA